MRTSHSVTPGPNRVETAYFLWLACLLQIHGLHRLYNGKMVTGVLWLCTFGLFGVGQFVDLFFIPRMVEDHNVKWRSRQGLSASGVPLASMQQVWSREAAIAPELAANALVLKLLAAADARQGRLSVTQAVMATGAGFNEVEAALLGIVKQGYADITNDPHSGIVIYEFKEL
jgi:TM2 domain